VEQAAQVAARRAALVGRVLASLTRAVMLPTRQQQVLPAAQGAGGYVRITWCGNTPAPTGQANQSFCNFGSAPTVAALTAVGTGIQWYAAATGGTPLASTTPLTNGHYYASQTVTGCESSTRLDVTVTVTTTNVATSVNGNTITSSATGATYQWINCATGQHIANATAVSYTATANGSYAVIVTQNGCTDTSACVSIVTAGVGDVQTANVVSLYPNPATDAITVKVRSALVGTNYTISDGTGRRVKEGRLTAETTEISIHDLAKGVYHFSAGGQSYQTFTVVKR
jgi:hypothetical protein